MSDKNEDAIDEISASIENLRALHNDKPGSYIMQTMLFTKSDEIVNIMSGAFPEVKTRVVNVLNEIDPANGTKYQAILQKK
jgi:predicted LPLAT superfamily acyltransferase